MPVPLFRCPLAGLATDGNSNLPLKMLKILHEDAHLLVVDKPAGLLTQGRPDREVSLESMIVAHLRRDTLDEPYLGTVHRLDRPVSGVILWAKTPKATRRLADQFARREITKEYVALVAGNDLREDQGLWEDWLREPSSESKSTRIVPAGTPAARRAVTRFRAERSVDGVRRLRLWPQTGRTHQLRVQTAARGWPILGDTLYGSALPFPSGIALHARGLTIRHPTLGSPMVFEAELPASWPSEHCRR